MIAFFKKLFKAIKGLFKTRTLNGGSVHYMNSGESLPQPYTREEEEEKISLLLNGEQSVRKQLIEHNLRLVIYISKKFENTGVDSEDLISIGAIGLIKAVKSYDYNKNIKLATYASRCIENEILMHLRKVVKQKSEISIDEPLNVDYDGNELLLADILSNENDNVGLRMEVDEEKRLLYLAISHLNDTEREIMEMRFGLYGMKEYTQKEVADKLGISQSYISRLEKKIFNRLRKDLSKFN